MGAFAFPAKLASGATYAITVSAQPSTPVQTCTVTNGSGTAGSTDVTNVTVTCEGFGSTCPPGVVYIDSFTTDPSSRWTTMGGSWTWDQRARIYKSGGSSYELVWIGPRPRWTNYTVSVPVRIDTTSSPAVGGVVFRASALGASYTSGARYRKVSTDLRQLFVAIYEGSAPAIEVAGERIRGERAARTTASTSVPVLGTVGSRGMLM